SFDVQHAPPPEISPLSLHDALPIWRGPRRSSRRSPSPMPQGSRGREGPSLQGERPDWPTRRRRFLHEATLGPQLHSVEAGGGRIDRKSTRLNSSHRTISYAVFCLKK